MPLVPIIDGHFWVERDGVIIDEWFVDYGTIAKINGATNNRVYKTAPKEVSSIIYTAMVRGYEKYTEGSDWTPKMNMCFQNAYFEAKKNGGEIYFGSMGFKKADGTVWWEFGGEDWNTSKQFIKCWKPAFFRENVSDEFSLTNLLKLSGVVF